MELKDLEKILELANELNSKQMESDRDEILENVTEQIENAKQVFISVSENGCLISGSGINCLGALSLLVDRLKNKTSLDEDMIRNAVEIGLKGTEKKQNDSDIQELLEKLRKAMED